VLKAVLLKIQVFRDVSVDWLTVVAVICLHYAKQHGCQAMTDKPLKPTYLNLMFR
jgi:uncharacterized membrane protein